MNNDTKSFILLKYPEISLDNWNNRFNIFPKETIDQTQYIYDSMLTASWPREKHWQVYNEMLLDKLCEYENNQLT